MPNNLRTGMTTHAGRSLLQEAARFSNEGNENKVSQEKSQRYRLEGFGAFTAV